MRIPTLVLAGFLGALAAPSSAQFLESQSLTYSGGRMLISLALRQSTPSTAHTVAVTPTVRFVVTAAAASVNTDSRGYAVFLLDVRCAAANAAPEKFTVTVTDTSNNSQLTRDYLLKCVNGNIGSAWPQYLMIQGAFCNPADSSSSHLQIDRTSDLDGDGIYGDLNVEAQGRDPLDFPSEFAMDVNGQGTKGCDGGSPGGLFLPGGAARQVAWFADNRVWGGTGVCDWTTQMNFLQDMAYAHSFNGRPALFITSDSGDSVLIGKDTDGDGNVGPAEIKVFFDPNTVVNAENYSPDGVAVDPTAPARVYWISDKSGAAGSPTNQGLFRLTDGNADDAIAAGEVTPTWTGTTGVVMVEAQAIDHTELECLHVDDAGAALVNQTALGTIFRWLDGNGNGVAETGEVANWLTYNNSGGATLTVNVDFATNINFPVFTGPYFPMNLIESVRVGGRDVYYVASTDFAGPTSGYIFRCIDGNGDGDVNDVGEVTLFSDGTPSSVFGTPAIQLGGFDLAMVDANGNGAIEDSEVFLYSENAPGPLPSCGYTFGDAVNWRMVDLNGDGDALDAGEAGVISVHPTGAFNRGLEVIPGPIDGGFTDSFYSRSAFVTVQAANCVTATAGEYLELDMKREKLEEGTQGTPFAGNSRFTLVTRGGTGKAASAVLFSAVEQRPPFPFGSCTVGLGAPLFASIPAKVPDANGYAEFALSIPSGISGTLYFQALGLDPGIFFYFGEVNEMRVQ